MKKEREKTIRLAMILVAIVAVIAMVMPYFAGQTQEVKETEAKVFEEKTKEDIDVTVLGIVLLTGIVAFEAGTFKWMRKKEKQGYTFSDPMLVSENKK